MLHDIPNDLGKGSRISLTGMAAMVNIAVPDDSQSAVIWGAAPDSPIGPKVVIGIKGHRPGEESPRSYLAHLTADEAIMLAAGLLSAAADIAELESTR